MKKKAGLTIQKKKGLSVLLKMFLYGGTFLFSLKHDCGKCRLRSQSKLAYIDMYFNNTVTLVGWGIL